jgi:RNA polymerase sigma-70 factor, ECF subfamily
MAGNAQTREIGTAGAFQGKSPIMEPPVNPTENLIVLLTQHQDQLFRYIFSLVPREADARDIMQETSLALFRKMEQFDTSRPFLPWAYRFAYLQVQKHREKYARSPLLFSEDVMDLITHERSHMEPVLDERMNLLDSCLSKLTAKEKELVTSRYALRHAAEEMMKRYAMSRRTLFRNLEMLRQRLHECVTRQLEQEGMA